MGNSKLVSMSFILKYMHKHHAEFFACACLLTALIGAAGCVSTPLINENYPCYQVGAPVKLDGRMGDPAWTNAPVLKFYVLPECKEPLYNTEVRLLYDRDYLYVGYKAWDSDVWAYFTNRDDSTCLDDCLELFFQTDPAKEPYYGFEINALGTINDAYYPRAVMAGGGHLRWNKWNCDGLKVKVGIDGTLNNPYDIDRYWILEMAIPFSELPSLAGKNPQPGDVWQFHAARCEQSLCNINGIEGTSCAPLTNKSFHVNRNWLNLNFK